MKEELRKLQDFQDEEVEKRETFVVDTKEKANWGVRKIAHIDKQMEENINIVKDEIQKLNNWLESENSKLQAEIDWFSSLIEPWFRKLNQESKGKIKTIKLPDGEIQLRKQPTNYTRNDEELLSFLRSSDRQEFIKVKESPNWAMLKRQTVVVNNTTVIIKGTGEIVPGVVSEEKPDKFEIKITK